jgi:nucleoside 2-deoxyribosyltransferase
MRIYLAARLGRWPEMAYRARELEALGHEITSRWHHGHSKPRHPADRGALSWDLARVAREDLDDVIRADGVVLFTEYGKHFAGGRHVEAGYALALNKLLFIVGPRENVFYHLPEVVHASTWQELTRLLEIKHDRPGQAP